MSELSKRVAVALVGAPLVMAVMWYGDAALATLLSIASALAAWELFRIARAAGYTPIAPLGIGMAAVLPLVVHAQQLGLVRVPYSVGVLVTLAVVNVALFVRPPSERPLSPSSGWCTLRGA